MDQVKEFLGVLRRQHFWFIAPILLVVGLVGWMMANKKLSEQYEANKSKVQSYISQMQSVTSQQPHPNEDFHAGMEQLIADRRANVKAAWERKWERQKQELKWPDDLPSDFIRYVEQMRPIERVDVDNRPIPSGLRRAYQSFIKEMLPRLAARIGAKWEPANVGGARGFGDGDFRRERRSSSRNEEGDAADESAALVNWDPQNQALIEERFDWGSSAPSTFEVLYAQEDLWVLTDLIDIIKRTNGDAMIRAQAAIKEIQYIQIGRDVTPPSQAGFKVVRPEPLGDEEGSANAEEDEYLSEEPTEYGPDIIEGSELAPPAGPQSSVAIKMELVKNRYYNQDYEPIADLQTLLTSVSVAKRIPVRMRLLMDQRQISKLLVECANAPLTFEVRQIRFNPKDSRRLGGFNEEAATESFYSRQQPIKTLEDYESLDRVVELFGIIYIFNPVDEAILDGETPDVEIPEEMAMVSPADRRLFGLLTLNRS